MRPTRGRTPRQRHSLVAETPAARPQEAEAHFRSKLAFETDPADMFADLNKGIELVIVDTRSASAYEEEHIPGAISLPNRTISEASTRAVPKDRLLVTYCWGPGCNASTKGALRLAALGFEVKELIGGIEYWKREGYPVEKAADGPATGRYSGPS